MTSPCRDQEFSLRTRAGHRSARRSLDQMILSSYSPTSSHARIPRHAGIALYPLQTLMAEIFPQLADAVHRDDPTKYF